jgi:hypothetical protein
LAIKDYFIKSDDFIQDSQAPKDILWGNWRDKDMGDGLSRIYVDTINNDLVITPSSGGNNGYIDTSSRMLIGKEGDTGFDIRIYYRIGNGNVYPSGTGKNEYLYMYCYAADPEHSGYYFGTRLYIPSDGSYQQIQSRSSSSSSSWPNMLQYNYTNQVYEGIFRVYAMINGGALYFVSAFWANSNWQSTDYTTSWSFQNEAKYFFSMSTDHNSSTMYITKFEVVSGNVYYYLDGPEINSIYAQEYVNIDNIAPKSSKNIYLKSQMQEGLNVSANAEVDMKTRWRILTN